VPPRPLRISSAARLGNTVADQQERTIQVHTVRTGDIESDPQLDDGEAAENLETTVLAILRPGVGFLLLMPMRTC